MKRGSYAKVGTRNHALVVAIRRIKADHPFWDIAPAGRISVI